MEKTLDNFFISGAKRKREDIKDEDNQTAVKAVKKQKVTYKSNKD
jgi:hypothetical protein